MQKLLRSLKLKGFDLLFRGVATVLSRYKRHAHPISAKAVAEMQLSFSQLGEDLVIIDMLRNFNKPSSSGVYVDVGCFDPFKYSNTYLLYLAGWRGINIDGSDKSIARFNQHRPEDINLQRFVSDQRKTLYFLEYANAPTNKLSDVPDELNLFNEVPLASHPIATQTLEDILKEQQLSSEIHLLNIDCEGEDLAVLKGLDLNKRNPFLICIEAHGAPARTAVATYLHGFGYDLHATIGPSNIFVKSRK